MPNELVQIIMAVIIFFAAATQLIRLMIKRMVKVKNVPAQIVEPVIEETNGGEK